MCQNSWVFKPAFQSLLSLVGIIYSAGHLNLDNFNFDKYSRSHCNFDITSATPTDDVSWNLCVMCQAVCGTDGVLKTAADTVHVTQAHCWPGWPLPVCHGSGSGTSVSLSNCNIVILLPACLAGCPGHLLIVSRHHRNIEDTSLTAWHPS